MAGGVASQHRGAAVTCAAVNLLNYVAGNVGQTVRFGADLDGGDGYAATLALLDALEQGGVQVAIVHEANPAYSLPKTAGFEAKFKKAPFKVSTSLYLDETAELCDLLLPNHHALERWDDARSRRGVTGLMQPVMEPVFKSMATGDVLLKAAQKVGGALAAFSAPGWEAHLKALWLKQLGSEEAWRQALQRGGVYAESPAEPVRLATTAAGVGYTAPAFDGDSAGESFYFAAVPSVMGDGRFANRPWMLELSDPVTRITWHSWVEIHPDVAKRLDVQEGEILQLTSPHGTIEAPVYVYPGIHPEVVAVPLGLGHTAFGELATGRGVNALDLLDAKAGKSFLPYFSTKVTLTKTGKWKQVAKTEGTTRQLGRGIADAMTVAQAKQGMTPALAAKAEGHEEHEENTEREVEAIGGFRASQLEKRKHGEYANEHPMWGMVIDLARCTGCSACVTACYAENNIPYVGEADILRGREMTWMRIERYWEGGEDGEPLEARWCRCCASIVTRRPVNRCVPSTPRTTPLMGSTARSTTVAWVPVTAATTAPTRCATSTGTPTPRRHSPSRSIFSSIRTSRCGLAGSWKSALSACSGSAAPRIRRASKIGSSVMEMWSPPAPRPAPPAPSPLGTCVTRTVGCRSCRPITAAITSWKI